MVTDAFCRRIIRSSLYKAGCGAALDRAVRGAGRAATGCIRHPDRGSQYASDACQAALNKVKLRCSMTDSCDCYQNALAEWVNGILKDEFIFVLPDDLAQARLLIDQAVPRYNEERPHLALNHLTSNQVYPQGKSPAGKTGQGSSLIPVNKEPDKTTLMLVTERMILEISASGGTPRQ